MASFVDQFDPENDMLYGRGEFITDYLKYYHGMKHGRGGRDIRKLYPYNFINNYNMKITNTWLKVQNGEVLIETPAQVEDARQRDYHDALKDSYKYSPSTTLREYRPMLDSLRKSNQDLDPADKRGVAMASKDLAIRRSSKFGIEYALHRLGAQVHYILDGIDMKVVVNKTALKNDSVNLEKIPIVTSELRHVFRMWNLFRRRKLYFYKSYLTVDPPWYDASDRDGVAGWRAYAQHRVDKFKNAIQANVLASLAKAASDIEYIRIFHEIDFATVTTFY